MAKHTQMDASGRLGSAAIALLAGLAITQGVACPSPAAAAGLGSAPWISEAPFRRSKLMVGLGWVLRGLKWVSRRLPLVEPVVVAIEELMRVLQDARRSAEVHKKVDALMARVGELETKLASQVDDRAEIARLRLLLARLREELRQGNPYKLCCDNQLPRLGRPLR